MVDLSRDRISQKLVERLVARPLGGKDPSPQPGCPVCGSQDLYLDEVGPGWTQKRSRNPEGLLLGECQRCDYRWTMPVQAIRPIRGLWVRPTTPQEHAA
jgi:hypothetical protein